jgi:hypothetical protein
MPETKAERRQAAIARYDSDGWYRNDERRDGNDLVLGFKKNGEYEEVRIPDWELLK